MSLNAGQKALYKYRVDIWRVSQSSTDSIGTPSQSTSKIASSVPCYLEATDNFFLPQGETILAQNTNLFTLDKFHMEADTDVEAADILVMTSGSESGWSWTVRGDSKLKALRANKLMVFASRNETLPEGVTL